MPQELYSQRKSSAPDAEKVYIPRFIEGIELRPGSEESYFVKKTSNSLSKTNPNSTAAYASSSQNQLITNFSENLEKFSTLQFKYAQIMNVEVEYTSNLALYNFIDEWWATKYRFGGASKNGIDCSSLSGILHQTVFGNNLPRMAREQYQACEKISESDMKEGDLVFFNTSGGVSHVGVYLCGRYFVHSSTKLGVVISSLDEEYYKKRFIGAGRFVAK